MVATTSSGVGAVEAALAMEFDVILLDIEMETIQAGIDAAAAIHPQKPEAKIIYLTAHDNDDHDPHRHGHGRGGLFRKGQPR